MFNEYQNTTFIVDYDAVSFTIAIVIVLLIILYQDDIFSE